MMRIGIISDTRGLLRPSAIEVLVGVDHIIHAGDIGAVEVIATLREIADVTANDASARAITNLPTSSLFLPRR